MRRRPAMLVEDGLNPIDVALWSMTMAEVPRPTT
jgi:hypothetical protein